MEKISTKQDQRGGDKTLGRQLYAGVPVVVYYTIWQYFLFGTLIISDSAPSQRALLTSKLWLIAGVQNNSRGCGPDKSLRYAKNMLKTIQKALRSHNLARLLDLHAIFHKKKVGQFEHIQIICSENCPLIFYELTQR